MQSRTCHRFDQNVQVCIPFPAPRSMMRPYGCRRCHHVIPALAQFCGNSLPPFHHTLRRNHAGIRTPERQVLERNRGRRFVCLRFHQTCTNAPLKSPQTRYPFLQCTFCTTRWRWSGPLSKSIDHDTTSLRVLNRFQCNHFAAPR